MRRREFVSLCSLAGLAAAQENPFEESVTASATEDATPIVSIIPSSFSGAEDHDGTLIEGLSEPQPTGADLTDGQLDAMVRKALRISSPKFSGLNTVVTKEDWVVIKADMAPCPGAEGYSPGSSSDPRIVRTLLNYMAENGFGQRISVAGAADASGAVAVNGSSDADSMRVLCDGRAKPDD